jgi:hypothetical protein
MCVIEKLVQKLSVEVAIDKMSTMVGQDNSRDLGDSSLQQEDVNGGKKAGEKAREHAIIPGQEATLH